MYYYSFVSPCSPLEYVDNAVVAAMSLAPRLSTGILSVLLNVWKVLEKLLSLTVLLFSNSQLKKTIAPFKELHCARCTVQCAVLFEEHLNFAVHTQHPTNIPILLIPIPARTYTHAFH